MKLKDLALVLSLFMLTNVFAGTRYLKQNLLPRRIKIDQQNVLSIPQKSPDLEIVIQDNALPITVFAAQELQEHLQKALNTTIPIRHQVAPGKISFILGRNQWLKKAGIAVKPLERDAFIIKRDNRKIYIAGNDAEISIKFQGIPPKPPISVEKALKDSSWSQLHEHATLFGVYDFLERFVGVRFYFPHPLGVIIPRHRELKLPGIDIYERPDCIKRAFGIYKGAWEDVDPAKIKDIYGNYFTRQRNLAGWRNRGQTTCIPGMHGLYNLDMLRRFGATHPEFFAQRTDGSRYNSPDTFYSPQFCFSNAQLADEIFKDACAELRGLPTSSRNISHKVWAPHCFQDGYFSLNLPDGYQVCLCPKCRPKVTKGPQAHSEFLWNFSTAIARRVKAAGIPGTLIMHAYSVTTPIPDCTIPDNMHVEICLRGPYTVNLPGNDQLETIKKWYQKVPYHDISLYNYTAKYMGTRIDTVPNMAPRVIGKYYTQVGPYVIGAFTEGGTDNYLFNYLNAYIFGKTMWNNSCDYQAVLKEHYHLMFGPAAQVMEKIYEEMEDIWVTKIASRIMNTKLGPKPIAPSENEVWTQLYSPEKLADLSRRYDLAEKLTAKLPEELARVKYIRKHFLDGMLKRSKKYLAASSQVDHFKMPLPSMNDEDLITIDGKLDEAAWQKALRVKLQSCHATRRNQADTFVRVIEDTKNIYVAFECAENDPRLFKHAPVRKHDDLGIWSDNSVEIFISPGLERQVYYQMMFNSSGSFTDQRCKKISSAFEGDIAWESHLKKAIQRSPKKWVLETAIPKSSLPGIDGSVFCINFVRTRLPQDTYTWSPFIKKYHDVNGFGTLYRSHTPDGNLVVNSDFSKCSAQQKYGRQRAGAWSWPLNTPQRQITLDPLYFVKGTQSLKIHLPEEGLCSANQTVHNLKPNTTYKLSYFIRCEKIVPRKNNCGARAMISYEKKNYWFPWQGIVGTQEWFRPTYKFKTPAKLNSSKAVVWLFMVYASGTVWFDDIRLEEVR